MGHQLCQGYYNNTIIYQSVIDILAAHESCFGKRQTFRTFERYPFCL